ncbi:HTH ASNC domain containing protein [Pyrenophora tritici-repentis]|uniref:HTH-ASNC domain containing protein n=1 Tax=Pyrenophora tritici-repentis TaxID=45151 RepID=A0A5M9LEM0_9PLEO|nr:HTH-ASNC domain-containing protein [Pyrenophora tritici-repentis]KAF7452489.1 HTH ASNC domain containing protein [Pyrenophora tritici-repentis]KAG9386827.1 HTH ASNC domain containing protein [Pyrenophora tritici-repentis]KAI0570298.1 HTH-ASNC domain-containing protein [Pyrenophora tritici-repentis]KAI0582988.1 HTH-ASNC domain-containing protein [Pyrenophora tritici-repentis]
MDRASQALVEAFTADERRSYRAVAEKSNVPRSTLHRRKHGGMSKETKA